MEAPTTTGINLTFAPKLLVPYWIDGLASWSESTVTLRRNACRSPIPTLTEGNQLGFHRNGRDRPPSTRSDSA